MLSGPPARPLWWSAGIDGSIGAFRGVPPGTVGRIDASAMTDSPPPTAEPQVPALTTCMLLLMSPETVALLS